MVWAETLRASLRDVFSLLLSHVPFLSSGLSPCSFSLSLSPSSASSLLPSCLPDFSPLPSPLRPPPRSSDSTEHLHCSTLSVSDTLRGGVPLLHYVSWVFLRLMENTQNAQAPSFLWWKRNSLSKYRLHKGKFLQQPAEGSFSLWLWALKNWVQHISMEKSYQQWNTAHLYRQCLQVTVTK